MIFRENSTIKWPSIIRSHIMHIISSASFESLSWLSSATGLFNQFNFRHVLLHVFVNKEMNNMFDDFL